MAQARHKLSIPRIVLSTYLCTITYVSTYYVTIHRGCSGGGHFKKGIRTRTMRAFKASCNIISDRRRGGCSPRACVAGKDHAPHVWTAAAAPAPAARMLTCLLRCINQLPNTSWIVKLSVISPSSSVNQQWISLARILGPFLGGITIKKSLVNIKVHQLESCLASDF